MQNLLKGFFPASCPFQQELSIGKYGNSHILCTVKLQYVRVVCHGKADLADSFPFHAFQIQADIRACPRFPSVSAFCAEIGSCAFGICRFRFAGPQQNPCKKEQYSFYPTAFHSYLLYSFCIILFLLFRKIRLPARYTSKLQIIILKTVLPGGSEFSSTTHLMLSIKR